MPEIQGIEKLFSLVPRKRFGRFRIYGTAQFALSVFGDDDIYFYRGEYGNSVFGKNTFADILLLTGIYRTDNVTGKTLYYREPYYITQNPRTETQQNWRDVFADSVLAWQALTSEQKEVYNERAKKMRFSGYNLFLKEYLLSH